MLCMCGPGAVPLVKITFVSNITMSSLWLGQSGTGSRRGLLSAQQSEQGHPDSSCSSSGIIRRPAQWHSNMSGVFPRTWRCWFSFQLSHVRLQVEQRKKITAERSDEIQSFPNQNPFSPWLRPRILSITIINRTGDKGQPCWSPTCTGNKSDLLLLIWTKLQSYSP